MAYAEKKLTDAEKRLIDAETKKKIEAFLKDKKNAPEIKRCLQADLKAAGAKGSLLDVADNLQLTDAQIDFLYKNDLRIAKKYAIAEFGKAFEKLSPEQQEVLIDLCFNIGPSLPEKAPKFTSLLKSGQKDDLYKAQSELDMYSTDGKYERGLFKRAIWRMQMWNHENNGELSKNSKESILKYFNIMCVQKGEPKAQTYEEALERIMK